MNVGFQHASHMHACVQKGCGPQANLRRAQLPHNPWQSADETLSPWLMDRYIGFDGTDSMARAASTAGVVLSALVGLRVRPTVTMIVLMRLQVQCLACCRGMPAAMSARCFVSTAAVRMQRLPLSEMCVRVHLNFDSVLLKTSCAWRLCHSGCRRGRQVRRPLPPGPVLPGRHHALPGGPRPLQPVLRPVGPRPRQVTGLYQC